MIHQDFSQYNQKLGIKYTYLSAGKYKTIGNPDEPLSDAAKDVFNEELNYLYNIFVGTVALHRDVEEAEVMSKMADGRVFIGQQAVGSGLVDQVGNFETGRQI